MAERGLAIGWGVVLAMLCCACAATPRGSIGSGATTRPPSSSPSSSPVPLPVGSPSAAGGSNPPASLQDFVASTPGAGYASPIVSVGGVPTAVVEVTKSPTLEELDVVSLAQPSAVLAASLSITPTGGAIADYPFLPAADAQGQGLARIATGDITGDGQPDFLVRLEAADNFPGVVVSNDGGSWRLVPISATDPTLVVISRNPMIEGGHLTSASCGGPACVPSITLTWTYLSSDGGYFTSS